jgi:hypothetical protein
LSWATWTREHLLKVTAPAHQQPIQTLGPHRLDPALRVGVGVGCLHRRDQYLGAVRTDDVVDGAGEPRIPIANKEAHSLAPLAQHEAQVAGLLGNTSPIRVGGHAGHVDPPGPQLDEEQHIQPPQPHRVDGEEITGDDPGGWHCCICRSPPSPSSTTAPKRGLDIRD